MMDPAVFYPYNEQDEENINSPTNQGGVTAGTPGTQYTERIQVENGQD